MFNDKLPDTPEEQGSLELLPTEDISSLLGRPFEVQALKQKVAEIGHYYAHRIESAAQYCDAMAFFHASDSVIERMTAIFEDSFKEGEHFISLQEMMGISNDSIFAVYLHVQDLFEQEESEGKVENLLLMLVYLNPFVPSFWHALGVFYQKRHLWKEACNFYYFSLALNRDYTFSFFPLLGCLDQLGKHQEAKHLLEVFIEEEKRNQELQEWVQKGQQLLKAM